jgi:opacity protein-like surface antigen
MRNLLYHATWKSAIFLGILLAAPRVASAQALVTALRGTEIAPFAQYTLVNPDWGPAANKLGYTVGIDYTHFIRSSIVQPSLEFRYTTANGATVNERSYAGGLKLQTTVHGIHPYATLLVGHGNIDFNYFVSKNYNGDNSLIYAFGGGAEFNVTPQWKLRFDLSSQQWNTGSETLTPLTLGVGIAYSLPSHIRRVQ